MSKRNQKINSSFSRISFWNGVKSHLDSFTKVIDEQPYLTSDDRINLREIHYMLHLCKQMALYREDFHKKKLQEAIPCRLSY